MNSLGATVGPPSNVTRISRSLERVCSDGTVQVAMYHPGIGSRACLFDRIAGGAFGIGLDEVRISRLRGLENNNLTVDTKWARTSANVTTSLVPIMSMGTPLS